MQRVSCWAHTGDPHSVCSTSTQGDMCHRHLCWLKEEATCGGVCCLPKATQLVLTSFWPRGPIPAGYSRLKRGEFLPSGFMHRAPKWPLATELRARRRGPPQSCWLPSDPRPRRASLLQNGKQGGHPKALGTMTTTGPGSATGRKGQGQALESPTGSAPGSPFPL